MRREKTFLCMPTTLQPIMWKSVVKVSYCTDWFRLGANRKHPERNSFHKIRKDSVCDIGITSSGFNASNANCVGHGVSIWI